MKTTSQKILGTSCVVVFSVLVFVVSAVPTNAVMLLQVRDLISTSQASVGASHTIEFTTMTTIPVSGKIVVTPQVSAFTIPLALSVDDIDMAVATSSGYVERTLGATQGSATDGVSIVSGSSGSITFTLNTTESIPAGARIRIIVGSIAVHDALGIENITNPATVGSYRISVETRNAGNARIENSNTVIVIINQVTLMGSLSLIPPLRSNGLPSGTLAANNSQIEISLSTDEFASCRYATSTNVLYDSMTGLFPQTTALNFYVTLTGFQNATTYTYYVRCKDVGGTANEDDYPISFTLEPTPATVVSNGTDDGAGGHGGTGDFRGGSDVLYRANVTLSGWAAPLSTIVVVQDGKALTNTTAKGDGAFSYEVSGLERGAYTFFVYSEDSQRRKSGTFSSTLTLNQGTQNFVSSIIIPPTLTLSKTSIGAGESLSAYGESVPGSVIQLVLQRKVENRTLSDVRKFTATTTGATGNPSGVWKISVDTKGLPSGTYEVKAAATMPGLAQSSSGASNVLSLGIGTQASGGVSSPDLNEDKKINLVDFSILLSLYGKEGRGDFNADGKTNLGDVSIMLFAWTG